MSKKQNKMNTNASKNTKGIDKTKVGKKSNSSHPGKAGSNRVDYRGEHANSGKDTNLKISHNDLRWYQVDSNLEDLVASLSFNTKLGSKTGLYLGAGGSITCSTSYDPAGILSVGFTPTYGDATTLDNTMTRAAEAVYQYVRSVLRTTASYDATDMMSYLIAMDSAYMQVLNLMRVVVSINRYEYMNEYWPRAVVEAMGYDWNDLRTNYANIVTRLNFIIVELASRYCPALFNFMDRHRYLVGNVFKESDKPTAQLFLMQPTVYYRIVYHDDAPASLDTVPTAFHMHATTGNRVLVSQELDTLEVAIRDLVDNEDFNRIAADLMNAYGLENGIALPTLSTDLRIEPVYSPEINIQIHNSVAMGDPMPTELYNGDIANSTRITVDIVETPTGPGSSIVRGYFSSHYNVLREESLTTPTGRYLYTLDFDSIFDTTLEWSGDKATVIEGTRLVPGGTSAPTAYSQSQTKITVTGVSSEFVNYYVFTYLSDRESEATDDALTESIRFYSVVPPVAIFNRLKFMSNIMAIRHAPMLLDSASPYTVIGTTDMYTKLSSAFRSNLNAYCLYGEFNLKDLRFGKRSSVSE